MTTLMKRDFNNLSKLRDDLFQPFNDIFESFFYDFFESSPLESMKSRSGYPRIDIYTKDGKYNVDAVVPNMTKDQIQVEISDGMVSGPHPSKILTLSGKMSQEKDSSTAKFTCKEIKRSAFSRSVLLPDDIEGDPEAKLENGILSLSWNIKEKILPETTKKIIPIS